MSDEAKAQELISIFVCTKVADIENFLKNKAIQFEKLGKSRTFFIYDEDREDFKILGYFTLAIQVLKIPDQLISGRKARLFDGFSSKIKSVKITEFPVILIGQLGKNEQYSETLSGSKLLEYCLATILEGQALLGGRIILLECKNKPYLISLYEQFGFNILDNDNPKDELIQMIKILHYEDIITI